MFNIQNYVLSFFALLNLFIGSILIGFSVVVWSRRSSLSGKMLGYFIISIAIWSIAGALDIASTTWEMKVFWSKIQYLGIYTTPGFLFLFIYYFYKNNQLISVPKLFLLWIIPFLTIIFAFTNELHSLIWTGYSISSVPGSNLIIYHHGYWFWFAFFYYYGLLITSSYYLIRALKEFPSNKKGNALLLLISIPFPVIGNIFYNFNLGPWPGYDLTAVGFAISSLFLYWGVRNHNLADLAPIARDKLFDTLEEGLIIIDSNDMVVDHNKEALNIIKKKGYEIEEGILNKTVEYLIQFMEDLSPIFLEEKNYPCVINSITSDEPTLEVNLQRIYDRNRNKSGRLVIFRDITQQKQAEMQFLWQQRMLATENVRKKLGRELHDNLAQVLGYINLQSQTILNLIEEGDMTNAVTSVSQLINISQDATDDVRAFITESQKEFKPKKGFLPALNGYIMNFQQLTGLSLDLTIPEIDFESITNTKIRLQILRIIQESLSNVRKHSEASHVQIIFSQNTNLLFIILKDNGRGFDPDRVDSTNHFGLKIMKERAIESGGKLEIFSEIGKGSTIKLSIPINKQTDRVELKKNKYMIVDDHPLFVDGIKSLLISEGLNVIVTANNGEEAINLLDKFNPDVILLDAHMPGLSGQETAKIIKQKYPDIKILMLTMSSNPVDLQEAIHSGVNGYLLKDKSPQELFNNLERLMNNNFVISPELTRELLDRRNPSQEEGLNIDISPTLYELNAVELDILERVATGEGYKEIGAALNLSPHTIKYHFNKVMNKLNIENRGEAIRMAIKAGLIKGKRQTDPLI